MPAHLPKSLASLADLRRINRWFGGIATTEDMVERVARKTGRTSLSMLEVAAGSGYVPETARERLRHRGLSLHVTSARSRSIAFE